MRRPTATGILKIPVPPADALCRRADRESCMHDSRVSILTCSATGRMPGISRRRDPAGCQCLDRRKARAGNQFRQCRGCSSDIAQRDDASRCGPSSTLQGTALCRRKRPPGLAEGPATRPRQGCPCRCQASVDAMSLIVRTLEKIDGLQRPDGARPGNGDRALMPMGPDMWKTSAGCWRSSINVPRIGRGQSLRNAIFSGLPRSGPAATATGPPQGDRAGG